MHPVIARFLDLPAAVHALEKKDGEATLDSEESALIAAGERYPKSRQAVLEAKKSKSPSPTAQQHLIVLATRAATAIVSLDSKLGPRVTSARDALQKEGASQEEAEDLIAQAVLEEAFGYAEDPDHFDGEYLGETLESLVHLAALTQDAIDDWLEAFARQGPAGERALRLKVAELLLECAWSEGPQPITPEHVDDALEQLGDAVAASEFPRAVALVVELLGALRTRQVVGPLRLERLAQLARAAGSVGPEVDDEAAADDGDDDDDDA